MSYLDYQFEVLRGQIEELQGTLEEMLAVRRGQGGVFGSLRGRSRKIRGQARQSIARARHGAMGFRPQVNLPNLPFQQEPPSPSPTRYVLLAVGVVMLATALLYPGFLTGLMKQVNEALGLATDPRNSAQTSSEL